MKNKSPQAEQVTRIKSATSKPNTKYGPSRVMSAEDQIPNTTKSKALWKEVTEQEKEQIRQDSKKLLNEFASKLAHIKAPEGHFENKSGTREEGSGWQTDEEFQSTTLANAPFVEDDFLVAEKGGWKK